MSDPLVTPCLHDGLRDARSIRAGLTKVPTGGLAKESPASRRTLGHGRIFFSCKPQAFGSGRRPRLLPRAVYPPVSGYGGRSLKHVRDETASKSRGGGVPSSLPWYGAYDLSSSRWAQSCSPACWRLPSDPYLEPNPNKYALRDEKIGPSHQLPMSGARCAGGALNLLRRVGDSGAQIFDYRFDPGSLSAACRL